VEERADAHAHLSIQDSRVYARALEKIGEANLSPAVTEEAGTHPHLYDRMVSAGFTPGYPRPAPTRSVRGWRILIAIAVCVELATVDSMTRPKTVGRDERSVMAALALGGWTAEHLDSLAGLREARGDHESAARFRTAANSIRRDAPQADTDSQR